MIQHLSHPPINSVNNGIPDEFAHVKYSTVDEAIKIICQLGKQCYMSKTDIESAFRIIPISPEDYHLLGFKLFGKYYYDTCLVMGLRSSCQIFESFSTTLHQIAHRQLKIPYMVHLLDDFFIISETKQTCSNHLHKFLKLCDYIGVPMSKEKTFQPSTVMSFLGIELDTDKFEARLPLEKLQKCNDLITSAIPKKKLTLKEIQEITGLLNFSCQVVLPGRAFLRRLINLTIGVKQSYHYVRLTREAKKDLEAWSNFLQSFNGVSILYFEPWVQSNCFHLYSDAAQSIGYGAMLENKWIHGLWPNDWSSKSISFLELYPIVISLVIWSSQLISKRIILHTDNQALVSIINKSTSKNSDIMVLIRLLVMTCMKFGIQVFAEHIPGKNNVLTDSLSRSQLNKFRQMAPWADQHPTQIPQHLKPNNLC